MHKINAHAWRTEVDKPFTVVGTIRRREENGTWWLIDSDDLPFPMELSALSLGRWRNVA